MGQRTSPTSPGVPAPQYLDEPYLPVEVDDVLLAFPATIEHLLPQRGTFEQHIDHRWTLFVQSWFYNGLTSRAIFHVADDIDGERAFRHLRCVLGTFEIKHEYKIDAAAFLAGRWIRAVIDGEDTWGHDDAITALREVEAEYRAEQKTGTDG